MSALHVELLTKAAVILKNKHSFCICYALDKAVDQIGRHADPAANEICNHIGDLLEESAWLQGWLSKRYVIPTMPRDAYDAKMLETRLRWIDWLIEEWRHAA